MNTTKLGRPLRRKFIVPLVIIPLLFLFSDCSNESSAKRGKPVVFQNVSVIDAVGGQRDRQSVVITGNRIIKAGPADDTAIPKDAVVIDCSGKFMIPGLWDAHAHLTNEDASMPELFPLLVASGITYIRDTGATLESILSLRKEANEALESQGMAPRIYMTGPHIDGLKLSWNSSVSAGTIDQARLIMDSLMKAGVNEIKVYDLIPREVALEVFSAAGKKNYPI